MIDTTVSLSSLHHARQFKKMSFLCIGQNCGQDKLWPGGFDWFPCQHGRFEHVLEPQDYWINNTTFCGGSNSTCVGEKYYNTKPTISITSPGVVRNDYPVGQAPLVPQA